jgi:Holliday junction resolvasome RuvABC endonuclease subunit
MNKPIYYMGADLGENTSLVWFVDNEFNGMKYCLFQLGGGVLTHNQKPAKLAVEILTAFRYYFDYMGGDIVLCVEDSPLVKNSKVHGDLHNYAGVVIGTIMALALETSSKVTTILVDNKAAKAFVIGDGNAKKPDVVKRVRIDHQELPEQSDVCDAAMYALYGYLTLGGKDGSTPN